MSVFNALCELVKIFVSLKKVTRRRHEEDTKLHEGKTELFYFYALKKITQRRKDAKLHEDI